jgi:glycosyltransferase involved in cell wall biosynthesis
MERLDTICFGGGDWWYHNRAHMDIQLMRRFAEKGKLVYINSIVMQKPKLGSGSRLITKIVRKAKSVFVGLKKIEEGFWVYSPFSIPVQHINWARPLNEKIIQLQVMRLKRKLGINNPIIWVVCPVACDIALKVKGRKLVYQRTDRFEDFPNVDTKEIKMLDRKLKSNADLTIYVNNSLYKKESNQCRKAFYLDHGVDFEMFASAEQDSNKPVDIADIKKPIVGYFGALDGHKLDVGFMETVIDLLPEMSFVFVGETSLNHSRLLARKNLWMLGQKPYRQIPNYGKCFDVAIIPWRRNHWTEAANPIKVKEYLALGKPLVSTAAFTQLQKYLDVVYVADDPESFAECIKKALEENNPERIAARRKKVEKSSWDDKAQIVLDELLF